MQRLDYIKQPQSASDAQLWESVAAWPEELLKGNFTYLSFSTTDKQRPVVVLTRDSAMGLSGACHRCTHHLLNMRGVRAKSL